MKKLLFALLIGVSSPAYAEINLLINLTDQKLYVYNEDELVDEAPVSTGKLGKETPEGVFKVEYKQVDYWSRKYKAPMPHMQMIIPKWGIAIHGGNLPGYPASRGCIRLPYDFARKLYKMTKIGTRVTIER